MKPVPYSNSGFLIFGSYPVLNGMRLYPAGTYEFRVVGSKVQGSNDGAGWVDLLTINAAPPGGQFTYYAINNATVYRYVRLLMPAGSYGTLVELDFVQDTASINARAVNPIGSASANVPGTFPYTNVFDGNLASYWDTGTNQACFAGLDFGPA